MKSISLSLKGTEFVFNLLSSVKTFSTLGGTLGTLGAAVSVIDIAVEEVIVSFGWYLEGAILRFDTLVNNLVKFIDAS